MTGDGSTDTPSDVTGSTSTDVDRDDSVSTDRPGATAGKAASVALVTGGGSGIGASICRWLGRHGVDVVVADIDEASAHEVADDIDASSDADAHPVVADVTEQSSVERMVGTAGETFGRLDYLFANAGVAGPVDPTETSYEDWQSVIDVNLNGVYLTIATAVDLLREGENPGHVVVTASISGRKPKPVMIPYRVSKAAVLMLTHCLAVRLGPDIKINALCPGPIDSPLMRENYEKRAEVLGVPVEELRARRNEGVPLGRAAQTEDLHQILELLLFKDAFLTGQEFYVDGGDHQVF